MTAYREYPPHPALAPYVACYWSITSPTPILNRILPDGCVDIVLSDTVEVVGTMRQAILVPMDSQTITIGVRFKPGGGAAFFRLPLHEVTDDMLDLRSLWGRCADELAEQVAGAATVHLKVSDCKPFYSAACTCCLPSTPLCNRPSRLSVRHTGTSASPHSAPTSRSVNANWNAASSNIPDSPRASLRVSPVSVRSSDCSTNPPYP